MKDIDPSAASGRKGNSPLERWAWAFVHGAVLVVGIALLFSWRNAKRPGDSEADKPSAAVAINPIRAGIQSNAAPRARRSAEAGPSAEENIARQFKQFAQHRRELMREFAKYLNVEAPAEMEKFFDVAETGNWDDILAAYASLRKLRESESQPPGLARVWDPVQETLGVAEAIHDWPAQQLLDYGKAVLGSLRPGMVYVGGTDPGRFIPTFLNESEGERHIILTQNALADSSYLDYVRFQYRDQMATLTPEDSQHGFEIYMADAQRRLAHDRDFPNEPRQVRPGEDLRMDEGRFQVSGQVAVMAINEALLQNILTKNPDLTFAMEQSFPLTSTYPQATTLGPIMELRVSDESNALNAERAAQTVDYWRATVQQFSADPDANASDAARKTYSKMAAEQAALLLNRNFSREAEQAFQSALEIMPANPEAVFRYANLLVQQNRVGEAVGIVQRAVNAAPSNNQMTALLAQLNTTRR